MIGNDRVEPVRLILEVAQCFQAPGVDGHLVAKPLKHCLAHLRQNLFVINQENAALAGRNDKQGLGHWNRMLFDGGVEDPEDRSFAVTG